MQYNKISLIDTFKATTPFLLVRSLVYGVLTLVMVIAAVISISVLSFGNGAATLLSLMIFGSSLGITKWVERYILYIVKAGHIFAITEYIRTGKAPVTEKGYKGIVAFGTEQVKKNFGATNVAFVADTLISGAVSQITKFLSKTGDFLSFIPGAEVLINIISMIIGTSLNYIDEAVLSFIFMHREERNVWKKTCDAIVYYGQSWKSILKSALKITLVIIGVRCLTLGLGLLFGLAFGGANGVLVGLIIGLILLYAVSKIFIDPFATIIMIKDYYAAIEGQEVRMDLYDKFAVASHKFSELFNKSREGELSIRSKVI
ncbi:MAG: hypothetical protein GX995_08775 [Clostridiales bacterium]|jgi:hypothetical protein|nr:hypothetical protein [Clostridiales bacterium]